LKEKSDKKCKKTNNFISRLARINEIIQEKSIFGTRETTRKNFTRAFLNGDPLVIFVKGLQRPKES
jgi:hypothetical protein